MGRAENYDWGGEEPSWDAGSCPQQGCDQWAPPDDLII